MLGLLMSCDTGLFQAAEPSQDTLSYSIDALAHFIREATLNTAGVKRRHSKVISGSDSKISDRISGHVADVDSRAVHPGGSTYINFIAGQIS